MSLAAEALGERGFGDDEAGPAAREMRSSMSAPVSKVDAGMRMRPSFIAASVAIHSGGVLPSINNSRSPRLAPRLRSPLATREEASESSAKVIVSTLSPRTFSAGLRPGSPLASSASNQSSAQLKRFSFGH